MSSFMYFDPYMEMQRMQREMDRLFGRTMGGGGYGGNALTGGGDENRLALGGGGGGGNVGTSQLARQQGGGGQLGQFSVDWHPRCDLVEDDKCFRIEAELRQCAAAHGLP